VRDAPGECAGEGLLTIMNLLPERAREFAVILIEAEAVIAAGDADFGEFLWSDDGKGAETNGIQQFEDGGVGADAEREGEDGDGSEAGIFEEHAETEASVFPEGLQKKTGALFADVFFGFFHGAERNTRLAFGLRAGDTRAFEVVGVTIDVRAHFFLEILIELLSMEERRNQGAEISEDFHIFYDSW
jgi:hypothetical protein